MEEKCSFKLDFAIVFFEGIAGRGRRRQGTTNCVLLWYGGGFRRLNAVGASLRIYSIFGVILSRDAGTWVLANQVRRREYSALAFLRILAWGRCDSGFWGCGLCFLMVFRGLLNLSPTQLSPPYPGFSPVFVAGWTKHFF